jgi:hypothetical protein
MKDKRLFTIPRYSEWASVGIVTTEPRVPRVATEDPKGSFLIWNAGKQEEKARILTSSSFIFHPS